MNKIDAIMTSYAFYPSNIWVFCLYVILTSELSPITNFIVDFGFQIEKYPLTKFDQDQADILANMQVSSLFYIATYS